MCEINGQFCRCTGGLLESGTSPSAATAAVATTSAWAAHAWHWHALCACLLVAQQVELVDDMEHHVAVDGPLP